MLAATHLALALAIVAQAAPPAVEVARALKPVDEVRTSFRKQLDRPRVPLDPQPTAVAAGVKVPDGLRAEALSIATEARPNGRTERMPILIVSPPAESGRRRPAMIVLHGTGGTKEAMMPWLVDLARRGIVGIAIDARYHGERVPPARGATNYVAAITRAWRARSDEPMEHPFYYDTVWDLWRLVDYLETRPDLDSKRIGMLGISMGGIQTWLAASVDERIAVAVPAIAVQSFRWSLEHEAWQGRANTIRNAHEAAAADLGEPRVNERVCRALWSKVIPGILDDFDCPSMLRLFAPRPLLILNGEKDPNCPIDGARIAFAVVEGAYTSRKASDRLTIDVAPGVAHAVTPAQRIEALDWLVKHLQPQS
ncbi:MAG: alpha/beta fold hydrolase [Isosphaeraceae bacterium]